LNLGAPHLMHYAKAHRILPQWSWVMDKKVITLLKTQAYIDGAWVGTPQMAVTDKATGEEIARVPALGAAETKAAIEAAHLAFKPWSGLLAKERSKILRRWYELIIEHADELALLLSKEQGKPLAEAKGEILYGAGFVELFAEEAKRVYGETIPSHKADARIVIMKQPIGVVAAITPWNFPNAMITRKVAPALAAGCTVVVKPAEDTPLSALALAELAERAGFPKGVLNVVTASDPVPVGTEMTSNPLVRMITFTGSTEVGKTLMEHAARTVKRVGMELGGNAPFIVFDDADLDRAVAGAVASKFRNAGQTCVCANRILVQAGVYDAFAEKLSQAVADLKVGPGAEAGVTVGPLINAAAVEKVEAHVADAVKKGAHVVVGGKRSARGGTFYEPTVLTGVTPKMRVAREETFGPVAPLFKFETEAEAIHMANDTQFGLAAYFFTRDLGRCWRVAEALEYGIVGVNEGLTSTEVAPFGGFKESGIGREGSHHGIEEFVEIKYTLMGGL
jgi:succinate-semialdehyde dehydrogenase / glutarate-semialdehyde dehydrogenase